MANIRLDLDHEIIDGQPVTFAAPCDCTAITGLKVYHPGGSKVFVFKDAHGNTLTGIGNLFAKDAYVKAILDVNNGFAYIQNADTNAYLEGRFKTLDDHASDKSNPHGVTAAQVGARPNTWMPTASEVGARPASYTYASKNGGDCNSYADETHLFVFNMANRPSAFNYGFFDVWRASGSGFSPNGAKPIIIQRFTNWQYTSPVWRISTDGGTSWGEWMYENPPLNGGVEYTTTERYLDKPVKTKVINCGTVAKGGTLSFPHNCNISVLVRANIVVGRNSLPYLYNGDPTSQYSITGYVNKDNVVVKNGSGNSDNTVYAQIWYTNT